MMKKFNTSAILLALALLFGCKPQIGRNFGERSLFIKELDKP